MDCYSFTPPIFPGYNVAIQQTPKPSTCPLPLLSIPGPADSHQHLHAHVQGNSNLFQLPGIFPDSVFVCKMHLILRVSLEELFRECLLIYQKIYSNSSQKT